MRNLPRFRHPEARQRPVEVVVEGLHGSEKLRRFCEESLPVQQLRVPERIFQIPALVLQIFRLGVLQMRSYTADAFFTTESCVESRNSRIRLLVRSGAR